MTLHIRPDLIEIPRSREWWAREAEKAGTSWRAIGELAAQVVESMQPCPTCGTTPCRNPGFCASCRKADGLRNNAAESAGNNRISRLPSNWDSMSIDALWHRLNDPRRWPTPQSTVDA